MDTLDVMKRAVAAQVVFRDDDIRGHVGQGIDPPFAHALGMALGACAAELDCRAIVVGKDLRLSSVELAAALQAGIRAAGMAVIDIGMAPTPLTWFAARLTDTGAAVSVTGDAEDENVNGFKMMLDGVPLGGTALRAIQGRMLAPLQDCAAAGTRSRMDAAHCYTMRLASDVRLHRGMKVAVECGHGVAAGLVPDVLRELGCEVVEVSGEPAQSYGGSVFRGDARRLADLATQVRYMDCELGLSVQGDGDRMCMVNRSGTVVHTDRLLILLARDILGRHRGARVIHDVKSSRNLAREIQALAGLPVVCRSGDTWISEKMRESGALLAGEMSGRIRFRDRWYGYSDGLYAAARVLEILSRFDDASAALDGLPQSCVTPELLLEMRDGDQHALVEALRARGEFRGACEIIQLEGLRVEYEDGFGLVRASTARSAVMLRFEGDDGVALSRIQEDFRRQLLSVSPGLHLPF